MKKRFNNTTPTPSIELYELSAIKGNPNAHYRLGLYYEKQNIGYKIEYHFDRALNSDGCWMASYKMAEYNMRQNKTHNAKNCLTAVFKHDFPLAELNLAILYLNDNELDGAKALFNKMVTNSTNDNHVGYGGLAYYYLAVIEKAQNGSTTAEIDHLMNSYKLRNMDGYRKLHHIFNVKSYDKRYVFLLAQYFQKHNVPIPCDHYFKLYHEHVKKHQTVGVCNRCGKQDVTRMPYGLNYHCCETCMDIVPFFYDDKEPMGIFVQFFQ